MPGIQYQVMVWRKGEPTLVEDALLPGLIPDRVLQLMVDQFVDREMGLCTGCEVACHCHVLVFDVAKSNRHQDVFTKLCPILFHDAVRPLSWKVEDLV